MVSSTTEEHRREESSKSASEEHWREESSKSDIEQGVFSSSSNEGPVGTLKCLTRRELASASGINRGIGGNVLMGIGAGVSPWWNTGDIVGYVSENMSRW